MTQALDTTTVNEQVKIKTLISMTRGTAKTLLEQKHRDGRESAVEMMETLRENFDIKDPPFVLWGKLQSFKRRDGDQIGAYKIKLQDKAQELLELDRPRYEHMVKIVLWNKIREELPEDLRWIIDDKYDENTLDEAMKEINKWTASHPNTSKFSIKNLKIEGKKNNK